MDLKKKICVKEKIVRGVSVRRHIILILREMLLLLFKNTSTVLPWKYYCAQHPAYWGLRPAHLLLTPNADSKWRRNTFCKILKCYLLIQIKKCIVSKKLHYCLQLAWVMALGRLPLAEDQPAVFKWHVLLINKGELHCLIWTCAKHISFSTTYCSQLSVACLRLCG